MGCPISRRARRIYRVARTRPHVSGRDVAVLGIRARRRRYQSSCERGLVSTTPFDLERSYLPCAGRDRSAVGHKFIVGPLGQPLGGGVPDVGCLLHARPSPTRPSLSTPSRHRSLRHHRLVTAEPHNVLDNGNGGQRELCGVRGVGGQCELRGGGGETG
jgi:hypothetical protein